MNQKDNSVFAPYLYSSYTSSGPLVQVHTSRIGIVMIGRFCVAEMLVILPGFCSLDYSISLRGILV